MRQAGLAGSQNSRKSCRRRSSAKPSIRFVCCVRGATVRNTPSCAGRNQPTCPADRPTRRWRRPGKPAHTPRSRCIPLDRCRSSRVRRIWGHLFGWMQSTGQASMHAVSLVPMQGSAITYAIRISTPARDSDLIALCWTKTLRKRLLYQYHSAAARPRMAGAQKKRWAAIKSHL